MSGVARHRLPKVYAAGADTAQERDRSLVDVVSAVALSPYLRRLMLMRAGYSVSGQVAGSKSIIC
jgi:hypothetical protein